MKVLQYIILSAISLVACSQAANGNIESQGINNKEVSMNKKSKDNAVAYFASGCFWCVEAVFESVKGVGEVESGYIGGTKEDANYSSVSSGYTNHAEAVAVYYDSTIINYATLLKVFFGSHDPSTLNRQGPDSGTQYRSAIFYQNDKEKQMANAYIEKLIANKTFSKITTEVAAFDAFYIAEDYHQDYEEKHPNDGYIRAVSIPRIEKFQKAYPELLK